MIAHVESAHFRDHLLASGCKKTPPRKNNAEEELIEGAVYLPYQWNNRVGEPIIWCLDRSEPFLTLIGLVLGPVLLWIANFYCKDRVVIFECFGGCSYY